MKYHTLNRKKIFPFSATEIFSESSSSEESDYSSDFESTNSFYSGSSEDTSSDLGTEDEEMAWDEENEQRVDCIVISSDEDSVELEPPATPSAPLTPGPQLDQDLQNWFHRCHSEQTEETHMFSQQGPRNSSESWDLQPGSPLGISGNLLSRFKETFQKGLTCMGIVECKCGSVINL